MALAPTGRLLDVKRRYERILADPTADPVLRAYAGDTLGEIVGVLRRRNAKRGRPIRRESAVEAA